MSRQHREPQLNKHEIGYHLAEIHATRCFRGLEVLRALNARREAHTSRLPFLLNRVLITCLGRSEEPRLSCQFALPHDGILSRM
jgi:hypothetical protein